MNEELREEMERDDEFGKVEAAALDLKSVPTDALAHEMMRRHLACLLAYFCLDTDQTEPFRGSPSLEVNTCFRGSQPCVETLLRALNNRFVSAFMPMPAVQED